MASLNRSGVAAAVTSWGSERGVSQADPTSAAAEIQIDLLRRDPWGTQGNRRAFVWLRAMFGLNPFLFLALFSGGEGSRAQRFYNIAAGPLSGRDAHLCHFVSWAAMPYWLEWVPFGWIVGGLMSRVRLTFWQLRLSDAEAAPYAGMLSVRETDGEQRRRETIQGRQLEVTTRAFGHRQLTSESDAFLKRYSLLAADEASDVAVRDMFGPAYLVFMTESAPRECFVELRGNVLSIGVPGLLTNPAELDQLRTMAERTVVAALDGAGYAASARHSAGAPGPYSV